MQAIESAQLRSLHEEKLWIRAYATALKHHIAGNPELMQARCGAVADEAVLAFRERTPHLQPKQAAE